MRLASSRNVTLPRVMVRVLHHPVPAMQRQQPPRPRFVAAQRRDRVQDLLRYFAVGRLLRPVRDPPRMPEADPTRLQLHHFHLAPRPPTVRPLPRVAGPPRPLPVQPLQRLVCPRAVAFHADHVLRPVLLHQGPLRLVPAVPRVQRHRHSRQRHLLQQLPYRPRLPALLLVAPRRHRHPARVVHQRHRLVVHPRRRLLVRPPQPLAVPRQRPQRAAARQRPAPQHVLQGPRIGLRQHSLEGRVRRHRVPPPM